MIRLPASRLKILHLSRLEIDDLAWNQGIANSVNPRVYALSWYLDAVTQRQWSALVSMDYRFLFPLPLNGKIVGLPRISRPILCQQLGLFGPRVDAEVLREFIAAIPRKYRLIRLSLNSHCALPELTERTNMELSLQLPLATIRAKYSKTLVKHIRRAAKRGLRVIVAQDPNTVTSLFRQEIGHQVNWNDAIYQQINRCLAECIERNYGAAYQVVNASDQVVAAGFFLVGFGRVINLFAAANEEGKTNYATHLLTDAAIANYHSTAKVFDFEGSDIPGVATFFQNFGAVRVPYYDLERSTLPYPLAAGLKLLKRFKLLSK